MFCHPSVCQRLLPVVQNHHYDISPIKLSGQSIQLHDGRRVKSGNEAMSLIIPVQYCKNVLAEVFSL